MTLTITGKNTSSAAIIILESGLRVPNQLFMIGAKAMIGIALAAIGERQQRIPRRAPARGGERDEDAGDRPDESPPTAS